MGPVSNLAGHRLYLDSNIFVYALEGLAPWHPIADAVLRLTDSGQATALTSELTLAECLVKPFRSGNHAVANVYLAALRVRPELAMLPISRPVLIATAQLRAVYPSLKIPDAIHVTTATLGGCDMMLTNDTRIRNAGQAINIVLLSDLTP